MSKAIWETDPSPFPSGRDFFFSGNDQGAPPLDPAQGGKTPPSPPKTLNGPKQRLGQEEGMEALSYEKYIDRKRPPLPMQRGPSPVSMPVSLLKVELSAVKRS